MLTKTVLDLSEAYCPECGPNHILDCVGDGEPEDEAWCESCGWQGNCQDLIDFMEEAG